MRVLQVLHGVLFCSGAPFQGSKILVGPEECPKSQDLDVPRQSQVQHTSGVNVSRVMRPHFSMPEAG